ncbi:DUF6318 family protein [Actinopolymorpha alba]|uniref:DUF6318 family protein n=1 Tax=Actinopolymorpha alba TaxID=533267 RepID=UPI00036D8E4C|nr:DUF6318 family protein [Actinopolymorpha alba]
MRRFVGATALLALFSAAASGCTGGSPEPTPVDDGPTESTSASASPSPTPTRTSSPASESPQARAVRRYVDLINQAQGTGDVSALRSASSEECQGCKTIADSIAQIYARGGSYKGNHQLQISALEPVTDTKPPAFTVLLNTKPYELVPSSGAKPTPRNDGKIVLRITVASQGERWVVTELRNES